MLEAPNLEKELKRFLKEVVSQSRTNLNRGNHNASKDLYNSLGNIKVEAFKNSFSAFIDSDELVDYGVFLNYGVKGVKEGRSLRGYKYTNKKPPLRFIRTWLKRKSGRFRSRDLNSRAFMVQNTIYQKGIKPTEFFSKPFEKEFNKLPEELVDAYGLDVDDFIDFVIKDE